LWIFYCFWVFERKQLNIENIIKENSYFLSFS